MKISAAQAYCILDTVGSSILTKSGEISVSYLLELPEAYSLDRSDLEERHNELFRAFQYVRTGFIHKQDVFLRRKFKPEYVIEGEGYIQTAERKYFDGREYLHHFCILSFTLSGLQSLEKAYQANPLAYSEKLAKADRDRLAEFLESVESAVSIIRNIRGTQIRPLNVAEVKQHLFRYVNGFHDDEGLRDIQCSDMIRIGQKKGIFFAVCDERYLPDRMKVYVTDSTLQEANSQLYMSMLERIGVHVPCSHVVNQIWKFAGGSYREELAERVKLFGRYREFDKAIKSRYDGLASYEQEIINEENVLCKTHLNVLLLEDDETILKYFLRASLPARLIEDLMAFFDVVKSPIAVRSSSLLEDSHYQPFAGIYSTYMVPKLEDKYDMLRTLSDAIKAVYASVFYRDSKAYMTATSNLIDQEKMAIVLQEVVGNRYNDRFYPTISGVARSLNFYPIGNEKAEDGIANIALGLGKYIVDGGQTLRFSPRHPHNILQMSTMDFALRETQTRFYALDLKNLADQFSVDDSFNLLRLNLKDADADGSLKFIVSTYDPYDQVIRDGYYPGGRKILSFVNVLQHEVFPLADTLDQILHVGQDEMGRPIEIEFAVNIDPQNPGFATFYLLQVRPIVDNKEVMEEDLTLVEQEDTILTSTSVLGHGIVTDVQDIIYVKTGAFCSSNNQSIAYDIEKMNRQFTGEEKNYVLVGPGRWGSSDSWLGIPVKWPHISNARVIVECGLENYRVDPSQGTHFFQNLTSFGVGYFTINPFKGDGWFDEGYLNSLPAVEETEYLRHVRFDKPVVIKMDGKKSLGVVLKPEK